MANFKWVADKIGALRPNSAQSHGQLINQVLRLALDAAMRGRLRPENGSWCLQDTRLWLGMLLRGTMRDGSKIRPAAERIDGSI